MGGTGDLGTALAIHLAKHYERVFLGSRDKSKAEAVLHEILAEKGNRDYLRAHITPGENSEVVKSCDLVIAAVPHTNALQTISQLHDIFRGEQILVSAVAPIAKSGNEFVPDIADLSVSEQISKIVPKSVRVATAFQTVPANILYKEKTISSDVLIACDDYETYGSVSEMVSKIEGLRPLYLGSLKLSKYVESLTSLLLNVSIRNKLKSPTIKVTSF